MKDSLAPEMFLKWRVRDDDPNAVEILGIFRRADRTEMTELTVPEMIAGKRAVAIGARAFCRGSSLTAIKLPKGPRKICGFTSYDIPDD